ncbi:MAG TPA: hypothetical protein VGC20_15520 [bacterium]|jgi:hypothetical protein
MNTRTHGCARGYTLWWSALILLAVLAAGCAPSQRVQGFACGERRLELAATFYEQAKSKLALHYKQRVDSALADAYHASQDSMLLAQATRNCFDFDEVIRRQAINVIKTNVLFQKLVVSNMRDQDPGVVIDLYGQDYRDIFKNDIR